MDVDTHATPPSFGSKRSPTSFSTSSSAEKRAKLILPELQLTLLKNKMKHMSDMRFWQNHLNKAKHDDSVWLYLLSEVLEVLTGALASTNLKGSIITSPGSHGAEEFVKHFNNEVFEEWKAGVREGVENNDWGRLISHRMTSFPLISI